MIAATYYRVSTSQQGESGLGLAAQKEIVLRFLGNTSPIAEFTEVESGKRHRNRPQLLAALELCKKRKATLVIAKLDRLSRNVAFIAKLLESGVPFVCCDNPHANKTMLQMMAVFAEFEREQISERVKAALGRVKAELAANGSRISHAGRVFTKLGGPNLDAARVKAAEARRGRTPSDFAIETMTRMRLEGETLRMIANELNRHGIQSAHDRRWHASTVNSVLSRLPECQKARKDETPTERENDSPHVPTALSLLNGISSRAIPSSVPRNAGRRETLDGDLTMADLAEAFRMLDTFASAGATHFDVTFLDIDGEKCGFRKEQTARQLRTSIPHLLPGLTERKQNFIIRPSGPSVHFVQLDDLNYEQLKPLSPIACLILETSPGNHQAWVAVTGLATAEAKDISRRLRKGTGADLNASGATRLAGTGNYKTKYQPDFPEVRILQAAPGRQTTKGQLASLELLAADEPLHDVPASPLRVSTGKSWPDYQRCVIGAPMKHGEDKPDISRADFFFSMLCAQRGWDVPDIAARLMELSSKAKENGHHYAELTAQNAVAASDRQRRNRA